MRTWMLFFLLLSTLTSIATATDIPRPFFTDYCTAYPEGTRQIPDQWKHCCVEHDLYFWVGGTIAERKQTDLRLKKCVEDAGAPTQARLIYAAVSIGGHSPIRFKTKEWGHAWTGRNRYQSLSEQETAAAIHYLQSLESQDLPESLKHSFTETLNTRLDMP